MADRKISELTNITGANVDDANDEITIVDASESETKAITREELFKDIDGDITLSGTVDGRDVAADGSKLDYITVTQNVDLDQVETDIAALANGMVYKGDWDASSGSFPGGGSAQTGWFYYVSVGGTIDGISFSVGDNIVATTDDASATVYASNWSKHDQTDAVSAVVGLTGSISKTSLLSALNVEDGAAADQTASEIKTAYESNADTNAFTDAEQSKLSSIEAGADVTDTANVTAAGALMDSEVTNLAAVKAFDPADYVEKTAATGSAEIPTGTEAQRDATPNAGYFRFNSETAQFEGYNGSAWGSIGGGATGAGGDAVFIENDQVVTTDYTIPADKNAMSTGPITIDAGATVTVSTGARYVVI